MPAEFPEVVVGVADHAFHDPPPFDVLLSSDADPPAPWVGCPEGVDAVLAELDAADRDAAAVLVQVLRLGGGLVAESLAYSTLQSGPVFGQWLASRPPPRAADEPGPPVLLDRRGDVLEITLNR